MASNPLLAKLQSSTATKQGGAEVVQNPPDALASQLGHYPVFRDAYRSMLRATLVMAVMEALAIVVALAIIATAKPQDRFFTSSVTGHNERIYPVDTPFDAQIAGRIVRSVIDAMSFGYLNYQVRFDESATAFLPEAFQSLLKAMLGEGGVQGMVAHEQHYEALLDQSRPLQVVRTHVGDNLVFEATYDIPVLLTLKTGAEAKAVETTPWIARVVTQRSLKLDSSLPFLIVGVAAQPVGKAGPPVQVKEGSP